MATKRVFISFDFDHDEDLRRALVGQARYPNSPFSMENWSVKKHLTGDWKDKVRSRIRSTDLTIVLCGEHTHTAKGVAEELAITREEGNPYFLLKGRKDRICRKPSNAFDSDKMYVWTWDNLRKRIEGTSIIEWPYEWLRSLPSLWILAAIGLGVVFLTTQRKQESYVAPGRARSSIHPRRY